jgi:hypothetical protein
MLSTGHSCTQKPKSMKKDEQFTYTPTETITYYCSIQRSNRDSCFLFEHLRFLFEHLPTSGGLAELRQLSVHKYNNIANQV